jgi:hypothetical protein
LLGRVDGPAARLDRAHLARLRRLSSSGAKGADAMAGLLTRLTGRLDHLAARIEAALAHRNQHGAV